jgi:replicative DNA helicase
MMLSKDAIADVVEVLRTGDFYRPNHATVFDAILDLYGRGEPADAIMVAAALAGTGGLSKIGGAPYLHTLIASVPTAANATYYARIVAERAVLRRLVEAGTRIVQLGYGAAAGAGREVDDIVDLAQQAVYDVTERRVSEDFAVLAEMLQPTLDEIEAVGAQGGVMTGVPTGFSDLDRLLNGLHAGQLIVVAGRPGLGKALALDTPLATPKGWTTMGAVSPGDQLIGADGRPTSVIFATEVMEDRACFEVEFSDGSVLVADGEHQWVTWDQATRQAYAGHPSVPEDWVRWAGGTRTTEQLAATLRVDGRPNHAIPATLPLDLPPVNLPDLDLSADSPDALRASFRQRLAIERRLVEEHGVADGRGGYRLTRADQRDVDGLVELAVGLGRVPTVDGRQVTVPAGRLRYVVDVRPVPSVPVRCVQVDNKDHLYLAGRSMIPTHNSTAAMDFARAASVRHNLASAIFSLEMSKVEIVMRLLAAESRVPLHVLRSGQLSDDDWTKLARRMGEISEAPLYVDDTPNMTLMEIRAKARRLKQRNDLKLVVVDYLQLMTSPKRVESRQQEVADLSRGLKLLAKEVDCPVVAVSQLNRGPEQRTDKRPQLSDLRESGCLTENTTILRADTGAPISFGDLIRNGHEGVVVWSLDRHRRLVPAPLTAVFPSGVKTVWRMTLASGRTVEASANHQFLTMGGWTELAALQPGSRIATPRRIPAPLAAGLDWSEHRLGILAHLIGDGCVLPRQPLHYTSEDEANLAFVEAAAAAEFGITARRVVQGNWQHTYLSSPYRLTHGRRNPIHQWFKDLGIDGLRSHDKRLPDVLYAASDAEIRTFLKHLWATDGCVFVPRPKAKKSQARIYYASSSHALAEGVVALLARLGIATRLYEKHHKLSSRPGYNVVIAGAADMRRFCAEVGVHGARGAQAVAYLTHSANTKSNTNVDTLPREIWDLVKSERYRAGLTGRQFQAAIGTNYCGSTLYKTCPSRERLARCAEVLDSDVLRRAATDDVLWDRVVAVEEIGDLPVYDATVKGTHNFIAGGIVAHNSIEQDADVVILLHRDDYYDKESPRAGEADFIIAKHRNGPTDTVTVAAQLHLSRFVDMAVV